MSRIGGILRELPRKVWAFLLYMRAGFAELLRAHPFVFSFIIVVLSIVLGILLVILWMLLTPGPALFITGRY